MCVYRYIPVWVCTVFMHVWSTVDATREAAFMKQHLSVLLKPFDKRGSA